MLKIVALTEGKNIPASRFRVRQYINSLLRYGIEVKEEISIIEKYEQFPYLGKKIKVRFFFPLYFIFEAFKIILNLPRVIKANCADLIWLQRDLVSGVITLEFLFAKKYVLDIDDAIWLSKPFGKLATKLLSKNAAIIFAGNSFIKEYCQNYNKNIHVIPTAIDTDRYFPLSDKTNSPNLIVGWTGSSVNLRYLYQIDKVLSDFINNNNVRFQILSDVEPKFAFIDPLKIDYIPWDPETEISSIQKWDIGLMPLPNDEFSKGKCSFKMLQYMAVGIPVIVSEIGMNKELLLKDNIGIGIKFDEDWEAALIKLSNSRELRILMGNNGRKLVENEFSNKIISEKIAMAFKSIILNKL